MRPQSARRRPAQVAAGLLLAAVAATLAGCGGASPPAFKPGGPQTAAPATPDAQSGPGQVVMPPFGKNVHIQLTSWLPKDGALARAVLADKDYELAYLYAEYTGGQSQDWTQYVSNTMEAQVRSVLSGQDVTSESFKGTIKIFAMTVLKDPTVKADIDVSACFDNAGALNTDLSTGHVLAGQAPSDNSYYKFTDQLAQTSTGQWQVVSDYPLVYYPRAKECKP